MLKFPALSFWSSPFSPIPPGPSQILGTARARGVFLLRADKASAKKYVLRGFPTQFRSLAFGSHPLKAR